MPRGRRRLPEPIRSIGPEGGCVKRVPLFARLDFDNLGRGAGDGIAGAGQAVFSPARRRLSHGCQTLVESREDKALE